MLSVFKKHDGSTSLTVVISIMLVVALLAATMQWYWANSSSADVQLMADLGALAEQESIGYAVMLMQIIDFTILSANMLGLLLHGIVIVAGVATAVGSPIGAGMGAGFLSKAVEIDKKYIQRRDDFVDQLFVVAEKINKVVPYFAFGYSNKLVSENAELRKKFNNTTYGVIPIPFPAQGKVERKASFSQSSKVFDDVSEASEKNKKSAQNIVELEKKLDALKRACYDADCYKNASDSYLTWDVQDCLSDFRNALKERMDAILLNANSLVPIEAASSSAQARLNESYEKDENAIFVATNSAYEKAFGATSRPLNCEQVKLDYIYRDFYKMDFYQLEHFEGERKAYHCDKNCSGLLNAHEQLNLVPFSAVAYHEEHPPCSICMPFSWEALARFKDGLRQFEPNWNKEAELIGQYEKVSAQLLNAQQKAQDDSQTAFNALLEKASEIIAADRLSYQPPGARGVLCIAFSQQSRKAPTFTLSKLTRTDDKELGISVALSAARLKPVDDDQVEQTIEAQQKDYREKNLKFGSAVFGFLDMDSGLFSQMLSLWTGVTKLFTKGSSGLGGMFDQLPWGVGAIAHNFMMRVERIAGISPPDLSSYRPFVVNTSDVGDKNAPGFEGEFVKSLANSKRTLSKEAELSQAKLIKLAEYSLQQLPYDSYSDITLNSRFSVFDQPIQLLPWQVLISASSNAIKWSKANVSQLFGGQ